MQNKECILKYAKQYFTFTNDEVERLRKLLAVIKRHAVSNKDRKYII